MSVIEPPVVPGADEARRWAVDELAKEEYASGGESWLARVLDWFSRLLDGLGDGIGGAVGPWGAIGIGILVAAVLALIVWLVVGPLRRNRRRAVEAELFDDDRDAAALDDDADRAARAGDFATATMHAYRATIRRLAERSLIDLTPGLTAHEAAELGGGALAKLAVPLAADADVFDRIRYGHGGAGPEEYAHARATLERASTAKAAVT
ncbi:DUF4129 domain-containing protein [Demequina lignilytica]|uniref:DUF4129 domain-containing protein n=1 Tax=Demequina lignilytica TaxID=3051663 RepID=A0AB35MFW4_9MICO|nr:DUF4129 domain-containing protein [Demequina sp. SYSU T0a273]MDN4482648.1 DUF4129 domain-containing protein [Demequina sp. SYSU T0a273]